jgi:EpsI family protein
MASSLGRSVVAVGLLGAGLAVHGAIEAGQGTVRPELKAPLSSIPLVLGSWVGRDEPMDPDVLERTQADDHINRVYEDRDHPGRRVTLWVNYSRHGLNLRHSPEVCLPSGGWSKVESQTAVVDVPRPGAGTQSLTRLAYTRADLVQGIDFWYYIFGEGPVEKFARTLPISSRSSHGRTTRGSGLTVEVFYPGDPGPDPEALGAFARTVLDAIEPLLPENRTAYHVP